jgi:hypothetical protein
MYIKCAILNTELYLHIILYIWIFPRYLLFYSIFDKMPIYKHIYNNNQSLNEQNTCCKSTILLPDFISAILNLWTIADHLVYFNKNLLFRIYFVGNYKKYIKNNQYHRNTSFNIHMGAVLFELLSGHLAQSVLNECLISITIFE